MPLKKPFIWDTRAKAPRPIEGLHFGAVVAYDYGAKGSPRSDGQPHLGIVFETEFGRQNGKRVLQGLHVLTIGVHAYEEQVPVATSRSRMIPKEILMGQMRDLNTKNKYVGQYHLDYVPLSPAHLGVQDGIRSVGTIAGTDWGEKFFELVEGMPLDMLRSAVNIDAHIARQLSTYRQSLHNWASNDKDTSTRLGQPILSGDDFTVYTAPKPQTAAKPATTPKPKIKTPYEGSAVSIPHGKAPVLEELENNPDNIDLLIKTKSLHDPALWRKLKESTGVEHMYHFWILSGEEVHAIKGELRAEKISRKFDFIRTLHHFAEQAPEMEQEHLARFFDAVIDDDVAIAFHKRKPELVDFIRDSMKEGAVLEEIIRRCEAKAAASKDPQSVINDIPAAILAAGHLEHIKAEIAPETTPDLTKEFDGAKGVIYDVPLKDLFLILSTGRGGITRLLGGLPDEIQPNDGIVSMVAPDKDRSQITLRDAWDFLENISPKGDAQEIADILQNAGPISPATVGKMLSGLKSIYKSLDNIVEIDGQLVSENPGLALLIERGQVTPVIEP